jgi:hypothetical protein
VSNPFESGHIKNYVSLYASVLVIMALFFIASSVFHDVQKIEKKTFDVEMKEKNINEDLDKQEFVPKFKLMDSAY